MARKDSVQTGNQSGDISCLVLSPTSLMACTSAIDAEGWVTPLRLRRSGQYDKCWYVTSWDENRLDAERDKMTR